MARCPVLTQAGDPEGTMPTAHASWPAPTRIRVGDGVDGPIELAVHEAGEGPAVVLVHGFPELAYSWRYQLPALAGAGFHALAPDMRGYGGSSAPARTEAYDLPTLCADLVGLLDARGIERAVFVGHDWGGFVVWAMPLLHPDRCAGIVGVCTPYMAFAPTEVMLEIFGGDPEAFYITWFQEPGVAEAVMDDQVEPIFELLLRAGISPEDTALAATTDGAGRRARNPFLRPQVEGPLPGVPLVSDEELDVYVRNYLATGFRGGIEWYRNIDRNRELVPGVGETPLDLPCLMLCAEWDVALRPDMADPMAAVCSDLERHDIPRAGHWVQQEQPTELNAHLVSWLQRRFGS